MVNLLAMTHAPYIYMVDKEDMEIPESFNKLNLSQYIKEAASTGMIKLYRKLFLHYRNVIEILPH